MPKRADAFPNDKRLDKILELGPQRPAFKLRSIVRDRHDHVGVVTDIFADLQAAEDSGTISGLWKDWLREQSKKPKTKPHELWYGVLLSDGSVLVGEHDLESADERDLDHYKNIQTRKASQAKRE